MFRKRLPLISSFIGAIFIFSLYPAFTAQAATPEFSNCLLNASKNNLVSLGQPLAAERLAQKTNIRIGVLPFYFNNSAVKQLSDIEKTNYLNAAKTLRRISNNNVDVEIVFLESFKLDKSSDYLRQAYLDRNLAWSEQSTTKGTWGFVREVISSADPVRNFSNLDGVILETNNPDGSFFIAEAMGFFKGSDGNVYRDSNKEFYKSINTQDGIINNAILMDTHKGENTIVHELLHNFGLTDLYGSGTGPATLSIMASGVGTLLNYEKAVLGWFPVEKFQCKKLGDILNQDTVNNVIEISNIKSDSILLLKQSEETAYLIEVINEDNKTFLVTYLLEQNLRPPLQFAYDPKYSYPSFFNLRDSKFIGSKYRVSDFDLLVTNVNNDSATLNLIPRLLTNSPEAKTLIEKSLSNQAQAMANEKAKAEADEKAKAEADAKAKAEAALTVKKSTIYCIKGKTTLKVAAVKPKCPTGYKLKK